MERLFGRRAKRTAFRGGTRSSSPHDTTSVGISIRSSHGRLDQRKRI
jgi:hypothetical protein